MISDVLKWEGKIPSNYGRIKFFWK